MLTRFYHSSDSLARFVQRQQHDQASVRSNIAAIRYNFYFRRR
jgi:hypothetical protein